MLVDFDEEPAAETIQRFYNDINKTDYHLLIRQLLKYKESAKLSDWLYYQLVRKTAQQLSPKQINYNRYTLYKWYLLRKSGYDACLAMEQNRLLFYVRSDDNIYDIPLFTLDGKQYVCLNIHDFDRQSIILENIRPLDLDVKEAEKVFTYKIEHMPAFKDMEYDVRDIGFNYGNKNFRYQVVLNKQVEQVFNNYPSVDFDIYFNIPLSNKTYSSLIPALQKDMAGMNQKNGIEYLLKFTRYAFAYKSDEQNFGKEKRLTPEQTLLNPYSDCDDRVALFFYLVKEIYNLPMIVLQFDTHVTIAVNLDKPVGKTIHYNGQEYTICEPTPQAKDLPVGQLPQEFASKPYSIMYAYHPFTELAALR